MQGNVRETQQGNETYGKVMRVKATSCKEKYLDTRQSNGRRQGKLMRGMGMTYKEK
jgi:hypothetical protein